MYAIVATGGKQYKAEKDQVIKVEKIKAEVGETVDLQALMLVDGDKVIVGEAANSVSVKAEVVAQDKDKKVVIFKYKSKTASQEYPFFLRAVFSFTLCTRQWSRFSTLRNGHIGMEEFHCRSFLFILSLRPGPHTSNPNKNEKEFESHEYSSRKIRFNGFR